MQGTRLGFGQMVKAFGHGLQVAPVRTIEAKEVR